MIDAVVARLKAEVPDLGNRVEEAAFLAKLLSEGRMPQGSTAIVIPTRLQGGKSATGAGFFHQDFTETIAVLLVADVHDQTGKRALERLQPLIIEVISALAGWAPGNEIGVFNFSRGALASMSKGRLVYQIEMSITDQLRITT
ncbi:MAG: hypothetical protein COC12_06990 [Rhodobacteraceae bacterium]|nr:MAG: hypothetical protein COC12_06990 [Paracoccaceae bacterium]